MTPFAPLDEVAVDPARARVYEEGWQSWSPARLYDAASSSLRPEQTWQHLMRFRPGTPLPAGGFHAEGLLVVDPGTGAPVRRYSVPDPTVEVPSIRATLRDRVLTVGADLPELVEVSEALDVATALCEYGDQQHARVGLPLRRAPTVWCSWYEYFLDVREADILENLAALDEHDLPVDVVQVDDGWQAAVGDWLELSPRFSSMRDLASRIRDTGRRAGIWLAPFMATDASALAKEHPDWLMDGAGTNWGGPLHGLDLTRPDVLDHLARVFGGLRADGYDYFKLDFLYAGALPGRPSADATAVAAYRAGLEVIREAVGEDAFLLGCGAPILPSVGLVDAMRVSPDTFNPDVGETGDELRGRPGVEARAWQQGRLWVNDADCLVARPSFPRREEWASVVSRYSGLRSFSDRIADLDPWGRDAVRRLLGSVPDPVPFRDLPDFYER